MKNKKRFTGLLTALAVSMAVTGIAGAAVKYRILKPLGLGQDEYSPAVPFLLLSRGDLFHQVAVAREMEPGAAAPDPSPVQSETQLTTPDRDTEADPAPSLIPENGKNQEKKQTAKKDREQGKKPAPEKSGPPDDTSSSTPQSPDSVWKPGKVPVDDSWFDDALFIGDSRTMGLRDYARSGNADYFCFVGANVFNITQKTASDRHFKEQRLETLLKSKNYGKILIILGYNEAGYPHKSILKGYRDLIGLLRVACPGAAIIIQSVMTAGHKEADVYDYTQPSNICAINRELAELADNKRIFYIDVNPVFADESGYLPEKYSSDGAHLKAKACPIWADWLKKAVAGISS